MKKWWLWVLLAVGILSAFMLIGIGVGIGTEIWRDVLNPKPISIPEFHPKPPGQIFPR